MTESYGRRTGSDISIQFDNRLFGGNPIKIANGDSRRRPIAPGAAAGEYIYSVFFHTDLELARGESTPSIIDEM